MKLTAKDLLELGVIDEVIEEPLGGAHRDGELISQNIKNSIIKNLDYYNNFSNQEIYDDRKNKFLKIGRDKGFEASSSLSDGRFRDKDSLFTKIKTIVAGKYLQLSLIGLIVITLAIVFTVVK
jgi:acetyl-CoA carboxylase carboxyl transferase subunit alpha